MCTDCINKLNNILKFRKQCQDVESKLLSMISEETSIIEHKTYILNTTETKLRNHFNENDSDTTIEEDENKEIKNKTDIYDDKPLKTLLDTPASTVNVFKLDNVLDNTHNYESKTEMSDIDLSDEELEEKITSATTENSKKYLNDDDTEIKATEAPYELITDPVTQKATRVFCKLCNNELSIRSIDSHMMRRHPGADERKVKCDLCDSYILKEKLNRHMGMMHGSDSFRCGVSSILLIEASFHK